MTRFAAATALRRVDDAQYAVELHPGWSIGGKPNGGYLLAVLAKAGCETVEAEHPLAVSAHYLRAPEIGPATVVTEPVRRGRRVSTVRATLWQSDRACIETLISAGSLSGGDGDALWNDSPPPQLPHPDNCAAGQPPGFHVDLHDQLDLRLDPATSPFPTPNGTPRLQGWLRFEDDGRLDPLALLVAVDAAPPTVFHLKRYGWAPTVELTALLRGIPEPGWLRFAVRTTRAAGGWFDEDATVWDSADRVVAQARQLALVGRRP